MLAWFQPPGSASAARRPAPNICPSAAASMRGIQAEQRTPRQQLTMAPQSSAASARSQPASSAVHAAAGDSARAHAAAGRVIRRRSGFYCPRAYPMQAACARQRRQQRLRGRCQARRAAGAARRTPLRRHLTAKPTRIGRLSCPNRRATHARGLSCRAAPGGWLCRGRLVCNAALRGSRHDLLAHKPTASLDWVMAARARAAQASGRTISWRRAECRRRRGGDRRETCALAGGGALRGGDARQRRRAVASAMVMEGKGGRAPSGASAAASVAQSMALDAVLSHRSESPATAPSSVHAGGGCFTL
jgi:hypothetical protein